MSSIHFKLKSIHTSFYGDMVIIIPLSAVWSCMPLLSWRYFILWITFFFHFLWRIYIWCLYISITEAFSDEMCVKHYAWLIFIKLWNNRLEVFWCKNSVNDSRTYICFAKQWTCAVRLTIIIILWKGSQKAKISIIKWWGLLYLCDILAFFYR